MCCVGVTNSALRGWSVFEGVPNASFVCRPHDMVQCASMSGEREHMGLFRGSTITRAAQRDVQAQFCHACICVFLWIFSKKQTNKKKKSLTSAGLSSWFSALTTRGYPATINGICGLGQYPTLHIFQWIKIHKKLCWFFLRPSHGAKVILRF